MSSIEIQVETAGASSFAIAFDPLPVASGPRAVLLGDGAASGDGVAASMVSKNGVMADGRRSSLEAQIRELYADREALEDALGTSRVYDIISMVYMLREERDALCERVRQLEAEQRATSQQEVAARDDGPDNAVPSRAPHSTATPAHTSSNEGPSNPVDEDAAPQATGTSEEETSGEDMATHRTVQALLGDARLEQQWNDVVADWRDDAPGEAQAAVDWVRDLRDDLLDSVDTIDDPIELEEALAMQHIRYKSTWIMLNTKLQYQMMRHGTPNFTDLHRASLITSLIATLEDIMPEDEVQQIESFLSDPVNRQERK